MEGKTQPKKPWMYKISDSFPDLLPQEQEPQTYEEALKGPHSKAWQDAINMELQALLNNNTWEILPLPPNRTTV